jgi:hypothetical protein
LSIPDCLVGQEACGVVTDQALGGDVAAYAEQRWEPDGKQQYRIMVRSIATGRVLHAAPIEATPHLQVLLEGSRVRAVAVTANSNVAWVQENSYGRMSGPSPPNLYDVYAIDSLGFHPVRTELSVEPRSLRLMGHTLTWRVGAITESAMLN